MEEGIFTIAEKHPIRESMTISRDAGLHSKNAVTWFSLGGGTSITQESYDSTAIYIAACGCADFALGESKTCADLQAGDMLIVPGGTLCGVETKHGTVYTEIIPEREIIMNDIVKTNETLKLKDLISYEAGSIANVDIAHNDTMKFVLMAFDAGCGLSPHRAPGNAILTALEGTATIGYEGKDYTLSEGESFRFEKNGLHSVTANGRFKMSLLLVLE